MPAAKRLVCWQKKKMPTGERMGQPHRVPLMLLRCRFLMLSARYCKERKLLRLVNTSPNRKANLLRTQRQTFIKERSESYDNHPHSTKDLVLRRRYRLSSLVS